MQGPDLTEDERSELERLRAEVAILCAEARHEGGGAEVRVTFKPPGSSWPSSRGGHAGHEGYVGQPAAIRSSFDVEHLTLVLLG